MMRHNRVFRWFALILMSLMLLAVFAAQDARAQQGVTPIAIGDTVKGEVTNTASQQRYSLSARKDDSVTITMAADGGTLDPYLMLEDSTGKTLAKDDDSGGQHNARIDFTFQADGDYTIVATRYGQAGGSSTGNYTLVVKASGELATAAATLVATEAGTPTSTRTLGPTLIAPATEEAATLEPTIGSPTAPLDNTATATKAVAAQPTSEGLSNLEPSDTPNSTATATPTVRPTRTRQPTRTPTEVAQEETPTEEPTVEEPTATRRPTRTPTRRPTRAAPTATPNVVINAGPISDGDPVSGEIDDAHVFYLYTYEGAAGEQIALTMEAEGDLTPSVAVIPSGGNRALKVATAQEGESTVTLSVTLPDDGRYIVVATRAGDTKGTTSGSFTLTLTANASPTQIDPAGDPPIVIGRLRDARLVPQGGRLLFQLPLNSFTRVSTPGLRFLPVGGNAAAQNFVLNFRVVWTTAGEQSACGMGFWQKSNQEVSFVLLTNDGKVALLQRQGQQFLINYFQESALFTPKDMIVVTVIAIGDEVTLYVNGQLQTVQKGKGLRGKFELETFNAEGNTTVTNCRYPSGWVWTFDR
jgi:hypothetical protein